MNASLAFRSRLPIPHSPLLIAMAILYVVATLALFARFFWLCPTSIVSLIMIGLTAFCFRETYRDPIRGVLVLCFLTPLVGSLPHFAPERCPPSLLLIVAGFALGAISNHGSQISGFKFQGRGKSAASALFLLFAVSGVLTAWRYLNSYPFGGWPALDATVNVRQESAGEVLGAVWQTLVVMLSGPLVFLLVSAVPHGEQGPTRQLRAFTMGMFLACLVGAVQLLFFPSFGNNPYWVKRNRINATFTDPNGLGTFVALAVPLVAGLTLSTKSRWQKRTGSIVVVLGLAMLVASGSRTGAAGLVVAALIFPAVAMLRFRAEDDMFRSRVVFASLLVVVAVVAFAPLSCQLESKRWVLLSRLARTREVLARQGLRSLVLQDRWPLWQPTIHVALRHPVGGIGLGSFRYEMENIARLDGQKWRWLDNANNSYLQITSELGLVGLAIFVAVLSTLAASIARVIRAPARSAEERWIYPALGTAWFSFLVLLLTGMWLLFEQIQVMFWLLAAMFAWHPDFSARADSKTRRWLVALAFVSVAVIAVAQAMQNFGGLSLERRRAALGIYRSQGFHAWETDETGRRFRWTGEEARLTVPTQHNEIRIELLAANPDLALRPLAVWISLDGKPATRTEVTSLAWRWVRIPVPFGTPNPAELVIRVERTWRPSDFSDSTDERKLGVAVSHRIENVDAREPLPL